jgi:hypothetical protein
MSKCGRVTLIKSTLSNLPMYFGHVWVTHFFIFEIHVWIVLLNLNPTRVLFNSFQFCLRFSKPSKHNFKK